MNQRQFKKEVNSIKFILPEKRIKNQNPSVLIYLFLTKIMKHSQDMFDLKSFVKEANYFEGINLGKSGELELPEKFDPNDILYDLLQLYNFRLISLPDGKIHLSMKRIMNSDECEKLIKLISCMVCGHNRGHSQE